MHFHDATSVRQSFDFCFSNNLWLSMGSRTREAWFAMGQSLSIR